MKFLPTGKNLLEHGTYDFSTIRQTLNSPLARSIFQIEGVTRVFYGKDYLSVGKDDDVEWPDIKPLVFACIETHFDSKGELFLEKVDIPVSL